MAQSHLRNVTLKRRALERAMRRLEEAILQAADSGESYRDSAPHAGMSHQRVGEIVRRLHAERGNALGGHAGPDDAQQV